MTNKQCMLIIGSQYGDEGKGKFTDILADEYDYIVRFQGGDNAGHSIVINGTKYKLRLIPSGIFKPFKKTVIGHGVVVNPKTLIKEIKYLKENKFDVKNRLFISNRAHVITDYHIAIDKYYEDLKGEQKVGTTLCGIGPCYADKIQRVGIRTSDLLDKNELRNKIKLSFQTKRHLLPHIGFSTQDVERLVNEYYALGQQIKPYISNTIDLLNDAYRKGKKILFEGAQGTFLDIDMGTYPYVTSSSTVAGVSSGTGISMTKINSVLSIVKAYTSRVGEGPFVAEIFGETADYIRDRGSEYGTVTKRPRRIGWLDLVMLKYAINVVGTTEIALTLLDVLSGLKEIKICIAYKYENKIISEILPNNNEYAKCKPIYKTFKGWKEDITKINSFNKLPKNAQTYINFLSKSLVTPITYISVGNDRVRTIKRG
ncbi:MAG: adenylosuccinate synthase [Mycoplasmataceae bacterium]|nr:adenylosuccinate synthase [Mycoplasmataceae bacterium]